MDIYVMGPDPNQPHATDAWMVAVVVVEELLKNNNRTFVKCLERRTPQGNTYLHIVSRPWTS